MPCRRSGRGIRAVRRLSKCKMMIPWAMVSSWGGEKYVASECIVQVEQVTYAGRPDREKDSSPRMTPRFVSWELEQWRSIDGDEKDCRRSRSGCGGR